MELMAKAVGAAVVGSLCALALRRYVPELSLALGIVTAGVVLLLAAGAIAQVREGFTWLAEQAGLSSELTTPVVKVLLIAILSRLTGQVCRDAGEGSVALCCELAGTFAALCATLPLLRRVLELIGEFSL